MSKQTSRLNEANARLVEAYVAKLTLERYSRQTVRNYTNHFIKFLDYCDTRTPSDLNQEDIQYYIIAETKRRSLSASTINVLSYSIRFYYERILKKSGSTNSLKSQKKV